MLRNIVAVIAGFAVFCVVVVTMETANAKVFHPGFAQLAETKDKAVVQAYQDSHPGEDISGSSELALERREVVRELLAGAPISVLLVVLAGYVFGSVAGGFVTAWIGRRTPLVHGLVLGGLGTLANIGNNLMLPPPPWFWVASLIVFIPAAYVGARLAPRPTVAAGG